MKISIELEINPNEVGLATELLSTLRLLTEHVKGATTPVVTNVKELLRGLVAQLADETKLDTVATEIAAVLSNPSFGPPEKMSEELLEAFEAVVFNIELVVPFMYLLPKLPEPFKTRLRDSLISRVLQHLTKKRPVNVDRTQFFAHAEAFAVLVKIEFVSVDGAAQTIEKLLNKPDTRSAAVTMLGKTVELCSDKLATKCNPAFLNNLWKALEKVTEEAFQYDVQWITQFMGWSPHAAMLDPSMPAAAGAHQAAVAPAAAPSALAAAPVMPVQHSLVPMDSFNGHSKTIFTMCYNALHEHVISGGKDGNVLVWNHQGQIQHKINMPVHYVCAMDIHPRNNLLLVCGVATDQVKTPIPPCIAIYDTNRKWKQKGMLSHPDRTLISCLRCMGPETDSFITGETATSNMAGPQELVCLYDMSRTPNFDQMQPVHAYKEHENLVTCVAISQTNPNLFVSGSRDQTIRVWDKRADKSVGMFGMADPSSYAVRAHSEMVTWLDTADNLLLSTGVDGCLCFWDFRHVGTSASTAMAPVARLQVDQQPLLKVAVTGSPMPNVAAVSSFQGLYLVDFSNVAAPFAYNAATFNDPSRPFKPYHDIKWANGKAVLYGASEYPRVDAFHFS